MKYREGVLRFTEKISKQQETKLTFKHKLMLKILNFLAQLFIFFAQFFSLFFQPGGEDSRNASFAAQTSVVPIFATIQVATIGTKYFSAIITMNYVVILPIKAFLTVFFEAAAPIALNKWFTPFTAGLITAFTCMYAIFTDTRLTTFTFCKFPTFLAYVTTAAFTCMYAICTETPLTTYTFC